MAPLLSRLFSSRRNSVRSNSELENEYLSDNKIWKSSEFRTDQIRILLFRECDWRGRKLLFDSKSIKIMPPQTVSPQCSPSKRYMRILTRSNNNNDPKLSSMPPPKPPADSYVEVSSNGTVYQYLRPRSDVKMLGEMIFGSVAMSYKGSTMKIHTIRSPVQMMLSEIFPVPTKPTGFEENNLDDSCNLQCSKESCPRPFYLSESWESSSVAHSIPVDVPEIANGGLWRKEDSGFPASGELSESYDSLSSNINFPSSPDGYSSSNSSLTQSGSFSSLQRRWLRNRATSFEYGMKRTSEQDENGIREQRRSKLGIALVISLPEENKDDEKCFQEFFFSHISLIERHFKALQTSIANAYCNKKDFVHQVMQALTQLRSTIFDLYQAPRLQSPVWLSLMSQGLQNQTLCQKFITEFAELINEFDTKNTNFFISSLLTAVLTHHLSWVPTITPPGVPCSRSYHQKHSAKWLDLLAKSHPYNPLWVQLEDLYGVLGFPKRVTRTIVSGKRKELVLKFLFVLTYFIRCSELKESVEEMDSGCDTLKYIMPTYNVLSNIPEFDDSVTNWTEKCGSESSLVFDQSNLQRASNGPTIDCKCSSANDTLAECDSCKCSSNTSLSSTNTSQNKFKVRANELGLRLTLDFSSNPNECPTNTRLNVNGPDDDFTCRTPDLDSGISEESAEDAVVRNVMINSEIVNGAVAKSFESNHPSITDSDLQQEEPSQQCSEVLNAHFNLQQSDSNITLCPKVSDNDSSSSSSVEQKKNNAFVDSNKESSVGIEENSDTDENYEYRTEITPDESSGGNMRDERTVHSTPVVKVTADSGDEGSKKGDESDSDVNDENVNTITQTSQLLKEYLSVRFAFKHNLSALDKNLEESNNQESEEYELKITDAKNKFYVRSGSLIKHDENSLPNGCSKTNCECSKCKESHSQFGFGSNCESVSTADEYTLTNLAEISLPQSKSKESKSMSQCFGRSLYASYTDHYMPDFCLQGISHRAAESTISRDLHSYIQHTNHELISEAVCIVADTDTWTVHIESSNGSYKDMKTSVMTSQLISNMTESLLQLSKLKMSPDFCLMHLEDRLQELYFKSLLLTEHVRDSKMISVSKLSSSLGLDPSDVPLLMSIASTHSPYIVAAMPYS